MLELVTENFGNKHMNTEMDTDTRYLEDTDS